MMRRSEIMTDDPKKAYGRLFDLIKEIYILNSTMALLDWDEKINIPKDGVEHRGNQLAYLAGLRHEKFTSPEIGDLLQQLEGSQQLGNPDSFEVANVREIKHAYEKLEKIPKSLVEELTRVTTLAHGVWAEARQKSDFSIFLPYLEKIIGLKRQQADIVGYEKDPYDALLDDFETGSTIEKVAQVFSDFRSELVDLVKAISQSPRRPDSSILTREFPVNRQERFGKEAAGAIGYDFEKGRLDMTVHPFCVGRGSDEVKVAASAARVPVPTLSALKRSSAAERTQSLVSCHSSSLNKLSGAPTGSQPRQGRKMVAQGASPGGRSPHPADGKRCFPGTPLPRGRERGRG